MLGVFTTKYGLLKRLNNANWLFSLCLVVYAVLFCVDMPVHALVSLNKHLFLPFCMVVVVVTLFMARNGKTSYVEHMLEEMGKRTLDIYMIHYFFVSMISLTMVGEWLETSGNTLVLIVAVLMLSVIVTALSVGIGEVLHKGVLINKWVYGK